MRRLFSAVLAALTLALTASATQAQSSADGMRRIATLSRPAIDGVTLGGIQLGADDVTVRALLGRPDSIGPSTIAETLWRYDILPDLRLEVHLDATGVRAIGLSLEPGAQAGASPETVRAVRLGSPVSVVTERYGAPTHGQLWYPDAGIAFNLGTTADAVEAILIFPRGTPAP